LVCYGERYSETKMLSKSEIDMILDLYTPTTKDETCRVARDTGHLEQR